MPCPNDHRKRLMTVGFRCTKEQNDTVTMLAAASGLTKQDFIMSKLTDTEVTIVPDTRTIKALRKELSDVYSELCRAGRSESLDEGLLERIELVTGISPRSAPSRSTAESRRSETRSRP